MATFTGRQKQFPAIKDVDEIITEELLEAAAGMAAIVGLFGSNFKFLCDDITGNIKKVRDKYETDTEKYKTLKAILEDEVANKTHKKDPSGFVGGLWLKRGMEYCCEFFAGLVKDFEACQQQKAEGKDGKGDNNVIKKLLQAAYDLTLTKYHGMASRLMMKAGLQFTPYKDKFMSNFAEGKEGIDAQIMDELRVYERTLRVYAHQMGRLYQQHDCKDDLLRLGGDGDQQTLVS